MLDNIVKKTDHYTKGNCKAVRKDKGQFFTPLSIAKLMANFAASESKHLCILEPGAGNGLLSAALIHHCIENNLCMSFTLTLIENDAEIIPILKNTVRDVKEYVQQENGNINIVIRTYNYLTEYDDDKYDIVICNPPYKKIRKNSAESFAMKEYVHGQPNLYTLFMCKALNNLKAGGKFVFITPRSWTSGYYYKRARKYILESLNITDLLLFNDRNNVFEKEEVLQETLITVGVKDECQNEKINLYHYDSVSQTEAAMIVSAKLIKGVGAGNYLLIPANEKDIKVIYNMSEKNDTLDSLGYCFKTGPVVEFRNKKALSLVEKDGYVPMYRSVNIVNGDLVFPAVTDKAQYVDASRTHLLVSDMNTVFLRRLSAKEENRRLQSCVYYGKTIDSYISVENHVNYLVHKDGSPLTADEVEWIHNLLMSDDYETYYRLVNGSTQVNASEINQLPVDRRS